MEDNLLKKLKKKLEENKERLERGLKSFAERDKKLKGDWDTRYPKFNGGKLEEGADEVEEYGNLLPVENTLEIELEKVKRELKIRSYSPKTLKSYVYALEKYFKYNNFAYLGRKYNYPIALEGAIKLKEISYIHAEGFASGELKHGPIALIDENFPTIAICPSDSVYEKMVSNIQEIKARNGRVLAVATEGNEEIKKLVDDVIYIPKTLEMLTPMLSVILLHLFAYYMAVLLGTDIDRPKHLAKSVTVE